MRDPRIDPQPGDVLRKTLPSGRVCVRRVRRNDGAVVDYVTAATVRRACTLPAWQDWARGADVEENDRDG